MTEAHDTISVVVVARHNAEGLLDLVTSVYPQLEAHDEILIVVDPPPKDRPSNMTREIAGEIARQIPLVRVLINEGPDEKSGYEQAIRACRGSCIFLAEPTDIWKPNKVSDVLDGFAMSTSVLIVHDVELLDATRRVLAPSLFNPQGDWSELRVNLFDNPYLGGSLAFLESFREFFLPFPPEVTRCAQWIGLIAERFGGAALITKPLVSKMPSPQNERVPLFARSREQRGLFRALKQREKELTVLLRQLEHRARH
jgi:hypothetical protein